LNRTTRSLSLTDVGREYLDGCRAIIEKLDEMESNLLETTRDPQGTLRIATPMTFATAGLGALLAAYRTLHPRVDFDVTTFDTQIDLVEGGFDVCFSDDRRLANSTLVSRTLTSVDELTVASPTYLARNGTPRDPAALNRHGLLTVSDGSPRAWEFADADGIYRVNTGSALTATSSAMVRVAALNHMGIALLPMPIIADDLTRGALVPVLEQFEINGGPRQVSILYSGRNYLSMRVRSFIDFAVSQYRAPDRPVALRAVA
jgi:DNA-binding transcriptional LysR family regulator